MAEYLSVGPVDAHTAMWCATPRREKLPNVDELDNPRYFPYRFGHAFWAYVGGRWGDAAISQILHSAAGPRAGPNAAPSGDPIDLIEHVLGVDDEQLSKDWHASILATMVRPLGIAPPTPAAASFSQTMRTS